jgi:hypothetical protein
MELMALFCFYVPTSRRRLWQAHLTGHRHYLAGTLKQQPAASFLSSATSGWWSQGGSNS